MIAFLIKIQTDKNGFPLVDTVAFGDNPTAKEIEVSEIVKTELRKLPQAVSHLFKVTTVFEQTLKPKKGR